MSASAVQPPETAEPLSAEQVRTLHAYWRAANYLSVGRTRPGFMRPVPEPGDLREPLRQFDPAVPLVQLLAPGASRSRRDLRSSYSSVEISPAA